MRAKVAEEEERLSDRKDEESAVCPESGDGEGAEAAEGELGLTAASIIDA